MDAPSLGVLPGEVDDPPWESWLAWLVAAWSRNGVTTVGSLPEELPPTGADLRRAEAVHGLPRGHLASLADYLRLAVGDPAAKRPSGLASVATGDDIAVVAARGLAGEASAHDWLRLGWSAYAAPAPLWTLEQSEELLRQLLLALPRGVRQHYRTQRTAAILLARAPWLATPMLRLVREHVGVPGSPVASEAVGLLVDLPDPAAHDLLLDSLERAASPEELNHPAWICAQLLERGALSAERRDRLSVIVLTWWRRNRTVVVQEMAELVQALPAGLGLALARALPEAAAVGPYDVAADQVEVATALVCDQVRAQGLVTVRPGSGGVTSLVGAALSRRSAERRYLSGHVLSASPYGRATADGLLDLLADGTGPALLRQRAARLVVHLAHESHRLRIHGLLEDPDQRVRSALVRALAQIAPDPVTDQLLRAMTPGPESALGHTWVGALGMTASPGLRLLATGTGPAWQRDAARWWIAAGPAIR